ncbi:MAG: SRPBCC family protein [Candidatus Omnitrophica bacterium]|nr:SRPBCC family protein [Candidatus Omnitrophota bacterium]
MPKPKPNNKDLMEITVSRIIPSEKWRVIRLLTKVGKFPTYIPTVKEVSIIEKQGNRLKTKWRIQVDKIPVNWIEEDILDLRKNRIRFKAVDGDLERFGGEWLFKSKRSGTEVIVNVYLKVGIPAINEFADAYLKKIVTKNFEAILEAVEHRLISMRYRSKDAKKIAGFGVIGHFYNFYHLEKAFQMLNPSAKLPSREFLGQLFDITPSFKLYDIANFKSKTGDVTNGIFIVATFIPDMIEKDMWAIFSKVVRACKIAEKHGVGVVALGGFTSIVGERIGQEISNQVDVAVTTGNTFTAVMTVDGVFKAARLLNMDIFDAKAAIIGGTGDIGSACARALVNKVKQLTITGRTKTNLRNLKSELCKKQGAVILATTDNEAAVKDADIVITAASATQSILKTEWFKPGSIICDVGYPKNVSYAPVTRQDIFIFSGGLAKSPTPITFPVDTGLPAADTIYGCFAEAIILALEKRYENFSFGRGNITLDKMDEIRKMGEKHGFEVSDFYWGHKLIDAPTIEKVKEVINV